MGVELDASFIPPWYRLFLLYIEPFSTAVGCYYAFFQQRTYLELTHFASAPAGEVSLGASIALSQLANLYLLFAMSEAMVLRSTSDLRVWRALVVTLLIADVGHLCTVAPVGSWVYYDVLKWNAIDWGNVGFVYVGAMTRIAFLWGVGFPAAATRVAKKA